MLIDDVWVIAKRGKGPLAAGDAKDNGWAATNFGLYGSSFVGIYGGIIKKTNIEGILQLDCLVTDYYHRPAENSVTSKKIKKFPTRPYITASGWWAPISNCIKT